MADRLFYDLLQRIASIPEFQGIGAKCIGQDKVAPGLDIGLMDADDLLPVCYIPCLRQFSRLQSLCLEQRAHPAVEKQQLLSQIIFNHKVSLL